MQSDFQRVAEELYQSGLDDGFRSGFINVLKKALEEATLSAGEPDKNLLREALEAIVSGGNKPELSIHDQQKNRYSKWAVDIARSALSAQVQDDEDNRVAISLGAAVLSKIVDPAAREIAIRNALIAASNRSGQVQELATSQPVSNWADPLLRNVSEAMHRANKKVPTFTGGAPIQTPKDIDGWQLVPKEPTHEMLRAMFQAMFEGVFDGTDAPMIGAAYDAALAAAPVKQEG